MKAQDLKYPYRSWQERKPLLSQGVLFIPKYYDQHHLWEFPGWEDPSIFGKQAKVCIEYCSGNGEWVIQKALENPEVCWVAVEKMFERVRKIWAKQQNYHLKNLLIVYGEALEFSRHYLPNSSIDEVFINFPDPWPKPRHAKHRLIQNSFASELARIVKEKGTSILVTDDVDYLHQIIEIMQQEKWKSVIESPYFTTDWNDYGYSFFDDLWRRKGKKIHYTYFKNNKCLNP